MGGKYDDKRWLLFNPQTDRIFFKAEVKGMDGWGFMGNSKTMQASHSQVNRIGQTNHPGGGFTSEEPSMQEYSI